VRKKKSPLYLIDYDLPQHSKCGQQFYRKVRNPRFKGNKSTKSVILSDDLENAKVIHKKASRCGKSNMYRVEKVE